MGTLFFVTLPVEIGFLAVLRGVGWLEIPFLFIAFFILFFCIAVRLLILHIHFYGPTDPIQFRQAGTSLSVARVLTDFLWSKGYDPDAYAMPVHSATMDLVGQLLLVACFEFVNAIGGKVRAAPDLPPASS